MTSRQPVCSAKAFSPRRRRRGPLGRATPSGARRLAFFCGVPLRRALYLHVITAGQTCGQVRPRLRKRNEGGGKERETARRIISRRGERGTSSRDSPLELPSGSDRMIGVFVTPRFSGPRVQRNSPKITGLSDSPGSGVRNARNFELSEDSPPPRPFPNGLSLLFSSSSRSVAPGRNNRGVAPEVNGFTETIAR